MTFVNCGQYPHENVPVLFSACCAGKVYFYPHALDADHNYSLKHSVLAFSNFYECPIFSMVRIYLTTFYYFIVFASLQYNMSMIFSHVLHQNHSPSRLLPRYCHRVIFSPSYAPAIVMVMFASGSSTRTTFWVCALEQGTSFVTSNATNRQPKVVRATI